jgi:hypothetical protein
VPQSFDDTALKRVRPLQRRARVPVGAARRSAGGGFVAAVPAAVAMTHRFAQGIERHALADRLGQRVAFERGTENVAAERHLGVVAPRGKLP